MDATPVSPVVEPSRDGLPAAIRAALALSAEDQHSLAQLLERTSGGRPASTAAPAMPDAAAFDEAALEEWIAGIAGERPWTRLQQLNDAAVTATHERERELLTQHRRALLEQHPAIAVREGVEAAAARNPGAVALGLAGLLLAAVTAAIGMFRAIL